MLISGIIRSSIPLMEMPDTRHAIRIRACKNPAAFVVLPGGYAKDEKHVYYYQEIVKKADPRSFEVLGSGYARDRYHVFRGQNLLDVDRSSFRVMENGEYTEV